MVTDLDNQKKLELQLSVEIFDANILCWKLSQKVRANLWGRTLANIKILDQKATLSQSL